MPESAVSAQSTSNLARFNHRSDHPFVYPSRVRPSASDGNQGRAENLCAAFGAVTARRYFALIPAAGSGSRLRSVLPKQYVTIAGVPMLQYALETFAAAAPITQIFVVVATDDGHIDSLLTAAPHLRERITVLRSGGSTRQQTVLNGLQAIRHALGETLAPLDWILVHDAARPGLTKELIDKLITEVGDDATGGLLALPVADTVKYAERGRSVKTLARTNLWTAQTPQMFRFERLLRALEVATEVTDEASAIESIGFQPILVEGSSQNFKVTLPDDIVLATALLKGCS